MFSSKLEIIDHFDNLIQRVDIDIEESLEKYHEEQVIGNLQCYKSYKKNEKDINRKIFGIFGILEFNKSLNKLYEIDDHNWLKESKKREEMLLTNGIYNELEYKETYKTVDLWSESTKVVDYLNQVRMRTIEELRKAQEETLEIYKLRSDDSKSQLFQEKFYFQVLSERKEWIFNLFTFVTDFFLSQKDITLLE